MGRRIGKAYLRSDVLYDWERYHWVASTMRRLALSFEHVLECGFLARYSLPLYNNGVHGGIQ